MRQKNTEAYVDKYISYLGRYHTHLEAVGATTYGNMYDFEMEHRLVEQCEAGNMLSVLELPTKDFE